MRVGNAAALISQSTEMSVDTFEKSVIGGGVSHLKEVPVICPHPLM